MAKRLAVLAAVVAAMLAMAVPATAQEGYQYGGATDTTATLTFELAVEGEPPADAKFLGLVPAEGGISVPLTDPDGDGLYTGSTTVDRFGPGPRPVPPDTEPVSLPVRIVQGPPTRVTALGPEYRVIKDFGTVTIDGDKTFSASVSFDGSRHGSTPTGTGTSAGSGREGDRVLPDTGGAALVLLGAGALLAVGGLLSRRSAR